MPPLSEVRSSPRSSCGFLPYPGKQRSAHHRRSVMISSRFFCIYGKMMLARSLYCSTVCNGVYLRQCHDLACFQGSFSYRLAPAGSTPMTLMLGFRQLGQGGNAGCQSASSNRNQDIIYQTEAPVTISMAMVPWPVATAGSSKGCTKVYPCSSASSRAYAQASSYTSPYRITSAP